MCDDMHHCRRFSFVAIQPPIGLVGNRPLRSC